MSDEAKPQRQDSLAAQLSDLRQMAQANGMYDAADFIRDILDQAALKYIDTMRRPKLTGET